MFRALLLLLVVLLAMPSPARAEPDEPTDTATGEADAATKAVARELGLAGIALYKEKKFDEAFDKLTRAHALVGLTTTGLWRARCLVALGRLVEGSEALFAVTRMALPADAKPIHVDAQRQAAADRKKVQARIPRLVVKIVGEIPDDTVVTLDGQAIVPALLGVSQPVDPGEHELEARGAGTSAVKMIRLGEGELLEVPIRLIDRDGPVPPSRSTWTNTEDDGSDIVSVLGWTAIAVGGAGLIIGAVTGGLAVSKNDELQAGCLDEACPPPLHAEVDTFETLRLTSTIAFIAGGVIAATGITLIVIGATSSDAPESEAGRLVLTPSGLRFEGQF